MKVSFRERLPVAVVVGLLLAAFLGSCDPSFSPIKRNNRYYSVFGYLNASADTQFVRVEKLRDDKATDAPAKLDTKVTLTNVTKGKTAILQDSVFEYHLQGKAHNFFTTMDIIPKQRYRLEVDGEAGTTSAEVQIPETFPAPVLLASGKYRTTVEMRDINRLAAVKEIFLTCLQCNCGAPMRSTFSHLQDTVHTEHGHVRVVIDLKEEKGKIALSYPKGSAYALLSYKLVIAQGQYNWPDFTKFDREAVALPNIASNVKKGVGYLGGIVSDTLSMVKSCTRVTPEDYK